MSELPTGDTRAHDGVLSVQGMAKPTRPGEPVRTGGASESAHECDRRHVGSKPTLGEVYSERNASFLAFARASSLALGWKISRRDDNGWTVIELTTAVGRISMHIAKDDEVPWMEQLQPGIPWEGDAVYSREASKLRLNYVTMYLAFWYASKGAMLTAQKLLTNKVMRWRTEETVKPAKGVSHMWKKAGWMRKGTLLVLDMDRMISALAGWPDRDMWWEGPDGDRLTAKLQSVWKTLMVMTAVTLPRVVVVGAWPLQQHGGLHQAWTEKRVIVPYDRLKFQLMQRRLQREARGEPKVQPEDTEIDELYLAQGGTFDHGYPSVADAVRSIEAGTMDPIHVYVRASPGAGKTTFVESHAV